MLKVTPTLPFQIITNISDTIFELAGSKQPDHAYLNRNHHGIIRENVFRETAGHEWHLERAVYKWLALDW